MGGEAQATGERALARMRTYTTTSLVFIVAFFALMIAAPAGSAEYRVAVLLVGGLAAYYCTFWERPAPLWLTIVVIVATAGLWTASVFLREPPITALILLTVAFLPISQLRRRRLVLSAGAVLLALVPVAIAAIAFPDVLWFLWALAALACAAGAGILVFLNRYAFNLYLEIDSARRIGAELAVAQERYRFAADLHDIQGHTLHVLRLKTQLAARLIERDPAAATEHLREADALIAETLASTRSLAFGERHVTLASELANAQALFDAAGIRCTVTGTSDASAHDELFGLVVRESTTNILRHAQPTTVSVALEPGRIVVTNDGSPASGRPPSGLARLAERFTAAGGSLRTAIAGGVFTTEAALP